jgi:hypothetical protein
MGRPAKPVDLTSTQRGQWLAAGAKGQRVKKNRSLEAVLHRANRFRMWRLRRDFKWAQQTAVRHGYNPEDVRWTL